MGNMSDKPGETQVDKNSMDELDAMFTFSPESESGDEPADGEGGDDVAGGEDDTPAEGDAQEVGGESSNDNAPGDDVLDDEAMDDDLASSDKDAELETLRAELEALKAQVASQATDGAAGTEAETQQLDLNALELFSQEEFDEVLDSRNVAAFNNKLIANAKIAAQIGAQTALRLVPDVVTGVVKREKAGNDTVEKFFTANKDLVPYKRELALHASMLQQKNPSLTGPKLFAQLGDSFRKTYPGLFKAAATPPKPPKKTPKGQPSGSGRTGGAAPKAGTTPEPQGDDAKLKLQVDTMF